MILKHKDINLKSSSNLDTKKFCLLFQIYFNVLERIWRSKVSPFALIFCFNKFYYIFQIYFNVSEILRRSKFSVSALVCCACLQLWLKTIVLQKRKLLIHLSFLCAGRIFTTTVMKPVERYIQGFEQFTGHSRGQLGIIAV